MKNTTFFKIMSLALAFSPLLTNAAVLTRQLELGMRGTDVGYLQTFLAQDNTIYPQGLVTGYFGSLTKSAVSNFQARNGISTVGRVGPQTLGVINAQMNGGYNGNPVSNIAPVSSVVANVSGSQATISWNTGMAANAYVYYSTSPISISEQTEYSAFSINTAGTLVHTDLRNSHSLTIQSLASHTTYYYVVYSKDVQGNENISLPATFTTSNF